MSIIEIKNLVKKYGNNLAVDNLNLKIDSRGVYGFLGPNGAGKSTTMNIITGYIGATKGTVEINGYDIFREPEKAKMNIGYLPEIPPLYQDMTVREYLGFVAKIKKVPRAKQKEQTEMALGMTGTKNVENRLIKNLSKGYKQRVGIAQAILAMPEVIILDEPTVGLDPKQIIEIRDLIKKLGEQHTVILSSHILTEISEVCEKIFIISKGKLVAEGTEDELVDKMAGKNILDVVIKGDEECIDETLKSLNIEFECNSKNDESCKYAIITNRDVDIREELFFKLADKRLPILEMNFKTKTLEDIFIELTSVDENASESSEKQVGEANELEDVEKLIEKDKTMAESDSKSEVDDDIKASEYQNEKDDVAQEAEEDRKSDQEEE